MVEGFKKRFRKPDFNKIKKGYYATKNFVKRHTGKVIGITAATAVAGTAVLGAPSAVMAKERKKHKDTRKEIVRKVEHQPTEKALKELRKRGMDIKAKRTLTFKDRKGKVIAEVEFDRITGKTKFNFEKGVKDNTKKIIKDKVESMIKRGEMTEKEREKEAMDKAKKRAEKVTGHRSKLLHREDIKRTMKKTIAEEEANKARTGLKKSRAGRMDVNVKPGAIEIVTATEKRTYKIGKTFRTTDGKTIRLEKYEAAAPTGDITFKNGKVIVKVAIVHPKNKKKIVEVELKATKTEKLNKHPAEKKSKRKR